MSESFAQLLEESLSEIEARPGEVLEGKVENITSNFVVVNAGLKSEALIPIEQFRDEKGRLEVSVGDIVQVALDVIEDGFGETVLSREKAKKMAEWKELEKVYESGKTIKARASGRVKGGFTVEIGSLKGFLPGSLVDVKPLRDLSHLEGQEVEVKVIKMDPKRNNVVVSRRAVLEEESKEERIALLEQLKEGQVVKGIVKNITDYGVFIDLGGVDGLLHITDMSWKRIKHPSEMVNLGDEINVMILKYDREKNRVSLGIKQLSDDPWSEIKRRYPVSSRHAGRVSNITDYGCFVELEEGIEGLVHVSEMDWTNKNVNPNKVVQLGEEVQVMVLDIDEERRRISLGIKQCQENPWETFSQKYSKGERIKGTIKSITDFGIFIGLEGSIDGLIHLSDISWDKPGEEAVKDYAKGQEVEAVILAIDPERERVSLGIKQLEETPYTQYLEQHQKGDVVAGKVIEIDDKRAVIDLGADVLGHIRASEAAVEKVEDINAYLKMDEEVSAQIISFDNKNRVVNLSIKALHNQDEPKTSETKDKKLKTARSKSSSKAKGKEPEAAPTTKLGDLLREQLEGKNED